MGVSYGSAIFNITRILKSPGSYLMILLLEQIEPIFVILGNDLN